MAVQKRANKKQSRRRTNKEKSTERNGVCSMCGYSCLVFPVVEFDDKLLCSSCLEETGRLTRYIDNLNSHPSDDDDIFFDDRV